MNIKIVYFLMGITFLLCYQVTAKTSDSDDGDSGTECLKKYLQQKGKLEIESTAPVELGLRCRFLTTAALRILSATIESRITSGFPSEAECLNKEFKNQDVADVIVKMEVIKKSELNEHEKQTRSDDAKTELKNDLGNVATTCGTDPNKFIESFNPYLGIKSPLNVTLPSLEHNYCFAKYVADNQLLPLDNIELNPYGIATYVAYVTVEVFDFVTQRHSEVWLIPNTNNWFETL